MRTFTDGHVYIFTFKDPTRLLSPIAHDLRLSCPRFEVTLEDGRIRGWFEPDAIEVDGPVRDGRVDPGGFGKLERSKILSAMRKDVLRTRSHREVRFVGTLGDGRAKGGLTLVGRTVDIEFDVKLDGDRVSGRVEISPSRWGIKPYKALLGALVLEDRVAIEFDLTARA